MDTMIKRDFPRVVVKIVQFLLLLQGETDLRTISGLFAEYVTAGNVWNKLTYQTNRGISNAIGQS